MQKVDSLLNLLKLISTASHLAYNIPILFGIVAIYVISFIINVYKILVVGLTIIVKFLQCIINNKSMLYFMIPLQ